MPVTKLNVTPSVADFEEGSMMVTFNPSKSPKIDRYIVNCTDNICQEVELDAVETSCVLTASSSIGGSFHTVCVCAVNRCGRQSIQVTERKELTTIQGKSIFLLPCNKGMYLPRGFHSTVELLHMYVSMMC